MDQSVPGFVPRFLRDDAVGLFRADERVFDAMVDGWSAQMLARGLQVDTIKNRCGVVRRFQAYSGKFPWTWRPVDIDDYMACDVASWRCSTCTTSAPIRMFPTTECSAR